MRCSILVSTIIVVAATAPLRAGDEDAVKKAVLDPQEAGWARHDFRAYMAMWSDDAKIMTGRGEKPGPHDITLNRAQIHDTRQFLLSGKPPDGRRMVFEDVKVKIEKDRAELTCQTTLHTGKDYVIAREIYLLRKTADGWKTYLNRGWTTETNYNGDVVRYNAETFTRLDEAADKLAADDKRSFDAGLALLDAQRFIEAHKQFVKATTRADSKVTEWMFRGFTALTVGDAEDALLAFRRVLKDDPTAPVPEFVLKK